MPSNLVMPFRFVFVALALMLESFCQLTANEVVEVLKSHCLECHDSTEKSGGIDLSVLLKEVEDPQESADRHAEASAEANHSSNRIQDLWARVEKVVSRGEMPPDGEDQLDEKKRETIRLYFRNRYILRNGNPHVGQTLLRRLTRYELQNTLEDVLGVSLKRPYVFSPESKGMVRSTIELVYPEDVPGESGFDNDAQQLAISNLPFQEYVQTVDYALRMFAQNDFARKVVFGQTGLPNDLSIEQATRIIDRFVRRAWRVGGSKEDRNRLMSRYHRLAGEKTIEEAMLAVMKFALLSPRFMYRFESVKESSVPYRVSPVELAVRLSYFLWSSPPDEELFTLARNGKLSQPEVLTQQIARMLNSPKRISLSENFAGQWLGFDQLKTNPVYYQGESWTRGVYDELLFSFDELLKSNRSILEIVDSEWVYLRDARLAGGRSKKIQLDNVYIDIFSDRRIRKGLKVERFYDPPALYQLEGTQFGGLITSTGIMRITSAPKRTNPIRRGVWILEKIIGESMQPPENIPPLAESEKLLNQNKDENAPEVSPTEILRLHTSQDSCRVCHRHIDPLGLGLENMDPGGVWRTEYPGKIKIKSEGTLPNGRSFRSPSELKKELLNYYKDRIAENMVRQMMAYALGRKIQPFDRISLDRVLVAISADDYRIGTVIEQIVLSPQFQCRQDD